MNEIVYSGLSDIGVRKKNQDSLLCKRLKRESWVFAVADGMGGAAGGEICSQLVIQTVDEYLMDVFSHGSQPEDLKGILETVFDLSQKQVRKKIAERPELQGMGTTLSIMLMCGNSFVVGHIGDSRLYLYRNNELFQMYAVNV